MASMLLLHYKWHCPTVHVLNEQWSDYYELCQHN